MLNFSSYASWVQGITEAERETLKTKFKENGTSWLQHFATINADNQFYGFRPCIQGTFEINRNVAQKFKDILWEELQKIVEGKANFEETEKYLNYLTDYFVGEEVFSHPFKKINPHKGIYMLGDTGCGKTSLMKAFIMALAVWQSSRITIDGFMHSNLHFYSHQTKSYFIPVMVTASEIISRFQEEGEKMFDAFDSVKTYESAYEVTSYEGMEEVKRLYESPSTEICYRQLFDNPTKTFPKKDRYPVLCIDDLGYGTTSDSQQRYGNTFNPLDEIIKRRYDRKLITFVTSNVPLKEVCSKQTIDRCKETFNVLVFDNESFRI